MPAPRPYRLPTNVWVLSAASFLTDVSSEMLNNLLPLFLYNVLGVGTAIIGLIDGIAETTASLVKIYSGVFSDRIGKRKPLTISGYLLSTLAKPFLYLATSWGWVLGVRFVDRIGKGIRTAPRDALLAGSVSTEQRGFAFGLHRASDTAGAFTGLGIAAYLIWINQAGKAQLTQATFQWVVLASILPAALAVLILVIGARDVEATKTANSIVPTFRFTWNNLDRRVKAFILVIALFTLGNSSDAFIILRSQERGLSVLQILGMLLTFNAIYTLLSSPAGVLSDRIGRKGLILAGWTIYGLVYLCLAFAKTGFQVWLFFSLYGIYYALTEGTARAYIADLVSQDQRGGAYGLFHAAIGLASLPASLIAGILWQGIGPWAGFGPSAPFVFGAGMAILSVGLLVSWVK